jgi:hypothetical protein
MADRISNLVGRQPRAEGKHPEPRLSKKRALAASQGRIAPETLVQHVVAQAKKSHRKTNGFSKHMHPAQKAWDQGESRMSWDSWIQLKQQHKAPTAALPPFVSVAWVDGCCRTAMF